MITLPHKDTRLPITLQILVKILSKLAVTCSNEFEKKLFAAAYSLAYFGFFRVGEIAFSKGRSVCQIIALNDIIMDKEHKYIIVKVRYSKTDQCGKGVSLKINKVGGIMCPVNNLVQYLGARPGLLGPLFVHFDGRPLSRYQFSAVLKKSLKIEGIDASKFNSHSFRIGAATIAAVMGYPTEEIQLDGRWSSNAYQSYVRPPVHTLPNLVVK